MTIAIVILVVGFIALSGGDDSGDVAAPGRGGGLAGSPPRKDGTPAIWLGPGIVPGSST